MPDVTPGPAPLAGDDGNDSDSDANASDSDASGRGSAGGGARVDRQERILEAVLGLLARQGISGVSMRAVAREAEVALGLVHYYYADKVALIAAALRRVEAMDLAIVEPEAGLPARDRVRAALHRVADPKFLTTEYLSLRLQLWALGQADEQFAAINTEAQQRYRHALAGLLSTARPDLSDAEAARRAMDITVVQNGMWLTALLGLDHLSIARSVARTEEIAFDA